MYHLSDTFNGILISRHRTIVAAIKARRRHAACIAKHHGSGAFLTYEITRNGEPIGEEAYWESMDAVHREDCL